MKSCSFVQENEGKTYLPYSGTFLNFLQTVSDMRDSTPTFQSVCNIIKSHYVFFFCQWERFLKLTSWNSKMLWLFPNSIKTKSIFMLYAWYLLSILPHNIHSQKVFPHELLFKCTKRKCCKRTDIKLIKTSVLIW